MTHKNSGDLQHYPLKNSHTPNYSFSENQKIIQIQNIDAIIMAKPMCTYKYQSTLQTYVYVYWWWSSVKVLDQGNRENDVEAIGSI